MTFCIGVKFAKSSNFDEIGLKLIRLTCAFRKCIDSYTSNVRNKGNQGVKGHSLCGVYGCWPLTPPLTYIRTLYIWQTILFWINIAVQLIWAHIQWDRTILKIWPLYERSLTFSPLFLYLDNETLYGYHVTDFFTPYDKRKNLRYVSI